MNRICGTCPIYGRSAVRGWLVAMAVVAGGAVVSGATYAAQTAPAATSEVTLEEVVVTAQRREQSIQSVPTAITAVTAETIEKANIRGVEQILAEVPNVSFVSNGSRDRKDISMRGVSNQLDPSLDVRPAAYALYIDEFNVTEGTSNPQVLDLERIEVLRGPQGTYFGRNATAGAINITTKKPNGTFGWEANAGASSFGTYSGSLTVNLPFVSDRLAMRVSGLSESSDGNIRNINAIGGGNNTSYSSGRFVLRWTPTGNITNDLSFSTSRERDGMRDGVPTGFVTATWANVYYAKPLTPGFISNTATDGVGLYPLNTDRVNYNTPQSVGTNFYYYSDRATIDFGAATLTAVAGHLSSKVFNHGDVDGSSLDLFYETNDLRHTSSSGEVRLASNGKRRFEWSIGASAGRDTGSTFQSTVSGNARPLNRVPGTEGSRTVSNGSTNAVAGFGQATFHVTDKLAASAGLRYTQDEVRGVLQRYSLGNLTDNTDRTKTFTDVSPRYNVTYTFNPDLMLYGTMSKGYKAGGANTLALLSSSPFYLPETLWSYEGGVKFGGLGGRLRGDFAVFYSDWHNVQEQTRYQVINAAGAIVPVTGILNAAAATAKGFDGSLDVRLTRGLTVSAHAGYTDGKFTSWPNALIDGAIVSGTGLPLINAPKWTAGANAEYRRGVFGGYEGFLRPEWHMRSEKLSSILGVRYYQWPFISPGYSVFNLRTGIDNGRISVTLYAENLFNKNYYENVYEKAFYNGVTVQPSVRNVGISLRYKGW